jgi:hypothetical protein
MKKLGIKPRSFIFGNICFEFSVQCMTLKPDPLSKFSYVRGRFFRDFFFCVLTQHSRGNVEAHVDPWEHGGDSGGFPRLASSIQAGSLVDSKFMSQ